MQTRPAATVDRAFRSRLLRAVEYKAAPFEIVLEPPTGRAGGKKSGRKLFGKSRPMGVPVLDAWPAEALASDAVYLSCGDSAATDLPDQSVDAVVTDPPFYDNVHYSELLRGPGLQRQHHAIC